MLITASITKNTINKRNRYGRIWGLAQEATLLAVDSDDNEIIQILKSYIDRKKKVNAKRPVDQQTNQEQESQFSSDDMVDEDTCESENEYISEESVISVSKPASSFTNVKNPPKVVDRVRPNKQRYISSVEKKQKHGGSSTQRSYKCGTCGKAGHNSAFHKKR